MKKYNFFNNSVSGVLTLLVLSVLLSCNKERKEEPTIAQIAVNLKSFSQLEAAAIKGKVQGVSIARILSNYNTAVGSNGNFTVFAPTNQAFAKLGLVNPQDLNVLTDNFLTSVLLYHVNNGLNLEIDLLSVASLTSLLGPNKRIIIKGTNSYVNGSKIISTNVNAENGVVHAIDKVLLASGTDIANTAKFFAQGKGFIKPELSILAAAIVYCNLTGALEDSAAKYTVFAPTNKAFTDLGKLLGVSIENPDDIKKLPKETVTQVLLTHVFNLPNTNGVGRFTSELDSGVITALNGKQVALGAYTNGVLSVKGPGNAVAANMAIPDVQTTNGVVHVIDRVLLP